MFLILLDQRLHYKNQTTSATDLPELFFDAQPSKMLLFLVQKRTMYFLPKTKCFKYKIVSSCAQLAIQRFCLIASLQVIVDQMFLWGREPRNCRTLQN